MRCTHERLGSNDEEGLILKQTFLKAMDDEGVEMIQELPGWALAELQAGDVRVMRAATAQTLQPCVPFLELLLGPSNERMICEAVRSIIRD